MTQLIEEQPSVGWIPREEAEVLIEEVRIRTRRRRRRSAALVLLVMLVAGITTVVVSGGGGGNPGTASLGVPQTFYGQPSPPSTQLQSLLYVVTYRFNDQLENAYAEQLTLGAGKHSTDIWEASGYPRRLKLAAIETPTQLIVPNPSHTSELCWATGKSATTSSPWLEIPAERSHPVNFRMSNPAVTVSGVAGAPFYQPVQPKFSALESRASYGANPVTLLADVRASLGPLRKGSTAPLNGVSVTEYSATIPAVDLLSWRVSESRDAATTALINFSEFALRANQVTDNPSATYETSSATVKVWLDSSGLMRKIAFTDYPEVHDATTTKGAYPLDPISVSATYSNFNEAVPTRPPSDNIFSVPAS